MMQDTIFAHLQAKAAGIVAKTLLGDTLPDDLETGMEKFIIDPEWAWIVKDGDRIDGFLAACPCHGTVNVIRLVMRKRCRFGALPALLRKFRDDCAERGYLGMFAFLDSERAEENRLKDDLISMGADVVPGNHVAVACAFTILRRW